MSNEIYVFDVDGVLIDSMPILRHIGILGIYELGYSVEEATKIYDETKGMPFESQLLIANEKHNCSGAKTADICSWYSNKHDIFASRFSIDHNLITELDKLAEDKNMAVISATHHSILKGILSLTMTAWDYFGGHKDYWHDKKHTKYYQMLELLFKYDIHHWATKPVTYFGDTEEDLKIARCFDFDFVRVWSPEDTLKELRKINESLA